MPLAAAALFSLWSVYSLTLHARAIAYGVGAASAAWVNSETLAYARRHLAGERPFINAYAPLYIQAKPGEFRNYRITKFDLPDAAREFAGRAGGSYLAWTDATVMYYNTADLLLLPGLEVVEELRDGFIFHYRRAEGGEPHPPTSAWYDGLVAGDRAAGAGGFALHLTKHRLVYIKEPCAPEEVAGWFFLHIYPTDAASLPEWRRGYAFDNLDFRFGPNGAVFDGRCLAAVPLPEYGIARIRTGQYVPDSGALWEVEFAIGESMGRR